MFDFIKGLGDAAVWTSITALITLLIGILTGKYLLPIVSPKLADPQVKAAVQMGYGLIDSLLDELLKKYPDEKWDDILVLSIRTAAKKLGIDKGVELTESDVLEVEKELKKKRLFRK